MKKFILLLMVCLMPFAMDAQVKSSKHSKKHRARKEKTVKKSSDQKKSEDIKVVELTVVEDNPTSTYPRQYDSGSRKGNEDRTVTRRIDDSSINDSCRSKSSVYNYDQVDELPQFPGGDAALMKFLSSHINYPPTAAERNIQGKVVVMFVVERTGHIGEVKVVKGVNIELDAEAVRVCRLLPDYIPGKLNGQPVDVWYTVPITFKLQEAKEKD